MVLASATGFGSLAILAKLGYRAGLGAQQALAFRFLLAAVGMLALAFFLGQNPMRLKRNQLVALLAMGAIGYCAQSLTYFLALRSLPASLVVLIAYIYPSLVVLAGWLFLHRSVSSKHLVALAASFAGLVMLVGGAHFQLAWALILAIASPVIYTGYILVGERVMGTVPALAASAVIITGAAISFCVLAAITNQLALPATHPFPVDMAPVALVQGQCFFGSDSLGALSLPGNAPQLRVIGQRDGGRQLRGRIRRARLDQLQLESQRRDDVHVGASGY